MSEKVRLPKNVCEALENNTIEMLTRGYKLVDIVTITKDKAWLGDDPLNNQDSDLIMKALVLGYEPELSAEEQLKELYQNPPEYSYETYRQGIRDALKIHGIHYDWLGEAE